MRSTPQFFIAIISLVATLTLLFCSGDSPVAGWGSETTNGVTAAVCKQDGTPASGAVVRLRRSDYVPRLPSQAKSRIIGADAITDENGQVEIIGIDPGDYFIEINDGQAAHLFSARIEDGDVTDLGIDTLKPYAAITGTIDTTGSSSESKFAQIPGLERLAAIDKSGAFIIDDLPAGAYMVQAVTETRSIVAAASNIRVNSGEQAVIEIIADYPFAKRLYLNTTSSGVGVTENVHAFPLLIRLDSQSFDFSQARDFGQDIRFAKPDGTALAHEIEHWDRVARLATLWVRIDTVYGNSDRQYIVMEWGNDTASSKSNSAAVFDTADGYVGTWHFGDQAPFADATSNWLVAENAGTVTCPGIVGQARLFRGTDTMTVAHTLALEPESFTLSCWFMRTGAQIPFAKMVAKGKHDSAFTSYSLELRTGSDVAGMMVATTDTAYHLLQTPAIIADSTWYCLTGVYDAASGTGELFLNGVSQGTFLTSHPIDYYSSQSFALTFGGIGEARFKGRIDEIRLMRKPSAFARVKLAYENQKLDSRLLGEALPYNDNL